MELEDKLKNMKSLDGVSIYDHINEILLEMVENQEEYPLTNFERYSQEIQKKRLNNVNKTHFIHENPQEIELLLDKLQITLKKPEKTEDEADVVNLGEFRNLLADEKVTKKAGVSISEEEVFYLNQSVKKLIKKRSLTKVDFWGKIFTRTKDYYILEVKMDDKDDDEEISESHEPSGTGINSNTYLVSNDILNEDSWIELPLITAKQMRQAKELSYIFTGNLDHRLVTSPIFSGLEKHYVN